MIERNTPLTLGGVATLDLSASFVSDPIYLAGMTRLSIQIASTGNGYPAGTFKLQMSNDVGVNVNDVAIAAGTVTGLSHWSDIPLTSVDVSTYEIDGLWFSKAADFRWVHVVWTRTSGSGILTGRCEAKGV